MAALGSMRRCAQPPRKDLGSVEGKGAPPGRMSPQRAPWPAGEAQASELVSLAPTATPAREPLPCSTGKDLHTNSPDPGPRRRLALVRGSPPAKSSPSRSSPKLPSRLVTMSFGGPGSAFSFAAPTRPPRRNNSATGSFRDAAAAAANSSSLAANAPTAAHGGPSPVVPPAQPSLGAFSPGSAERDSFLQNGNSHDHGQGQSQQQQQQQAPRSFSAILSPGAPANGAEGNDAEGGGASGKPFVYSRELLLSLYDEDKAKRRPIELAAHDVATRDLTGSVGSSHKPWLLQEYREGEKEVSRMLVPPRTSALRFSLWVGVGNAPLETLKLTQFSPCSSLRLLSTRPTPARRASAATTRPCPPRAPARTARRRRSTCRRSAPFRATAIARSARRRCARPASTKTSSPPGATAARASALPVRRSASRAVSSAASSARWPRRRGRRKTPPPPPPPPRRRTASGKAAAGGALRRRPRKLKRCVCALSLAHTLGEGTLT